MYISDKEIKHMEAVLKKYECIVMDCAVRQPGEFSVPDLHSALCSTGQNRLSQAGIKTLLDQLVKKKLIKKRYVRVKYLKFQPVYQRCFDEDFYFSHIEEFDPSNERHTKAYDIERALKEKLENNALYRFLHDDLAPCIREPEYLSEEEKTELKKIIDETD